MQRLADRCCWYGTVCRRTGRLVQDYIASLNGWIHQEFLPPMLGIEPGGIHLGLLEAARIADVCPKDYYQLNEAAVRTSRRMRRRPRLITAFWHQASLWPE